MRERGNGEVQAEGGEGDIMKSSGYLVEEATVPAPATTAWLCADGGMQPGSACSLNLKYFAMKTPLILMPSCSELDMILVSIRNLYLVKEETFSSM